MHYPNYSIELSWFINLNLKGYETQTNNEENYFIEELPIKRYISIKESNCLYYWNYLFNLLNIRDIEYIYSIYNDKINGFNTIFNEYVNSKYNEELSHLQSINNIGKNIDSEPISLFYDILGYLSFCTMHRILSFINKFHKNILSDDFIEINENIRSFKDIFPSNINSIDDIHIHIINYTSKINILLEKTNNKDHLDTNSCKTFFDEIFDMIKGLNGKYIKDYRKSKGRCFAVFVDKETSDKYISFSGYLDSEDTAINMSLGLDPNPEFITKLKKLASESGSMLIQTSKNVKRYGLVKYKENPYVKFKKLETLGTILSRNTSNIDEIKGKHACCERKIFAYFNDKTPDGRLHIKFQPCSECYLGIGFQLQEGSNINWKYGL